MDKIISLKILPQLVPLDINFTMKPFYIILSFFLLSCISTGYCQTAKETCYTGANEVTKKYGSNLPNTLEFSQDKVNYKDFSKRIKEKYPEYKDVDDMTLAKKVIVKYPYYKDKVIFDQSQNDYTKRPFEHENQTAQEGENSNFKLYNNLIKTKRVTVDELSDFETFNKMLSDKAEAIKFYKKLINKGFTEEEVGSQSEFLANINQGSITSQPTLSFQIDKIKVGDTNIELPIPSGFVKVDGSIGNLLESARKLCPSINTLLAYYISDEDYANYLVDQNYLIHKYILVQASNDLINAKIDNKDFRKLINSFRKQYVDEFKGILNDAGQKTADNISKIDENIKIEDFKMQPFGICYESKNSISYGILSKYKVKVENESSTDYVVAVISTISRIDNKPIFLFVYNTYNGSEDISSLKAINSNWVKEIDRKQSPLNFLANIDFEDYKEIILAILTLSFLWAVYFATSKIHKKIKKKGSQKKPVIEDNVEFIDFDELLIEEVTIPLELDKEDKIDTVVIQSNEEIIQSQVEIRNPEFLKASRMVRFFNFVIDLFSIYCASYVIGYIIGYFQITDIILNSPYLFGMEVTVSIYFLQEYFLGKTIGKWITKTRVVNKDCSDPSGYQFFIRSISRLIPFEAFSFLGSNKRGWHDTISDTYVINDI